jgi:GNAT superfamily N-acetyltransferase
MTSRGIPFPHPVTVRPAASTDAPHIVDLIRGLAEFEKLPGPDVAAGERVAADLANPHRLFDALVADSAGEIVGYALYFFTYSTFRGWPKLYIEDLFVRPERRNQGTGRALLLACARVAARRRCGAMEWAVLDWNVGAQRFYRRHGAAPYTEWHPYSVDDRALTELAAAPLPEGVTIVQE